MVNVEFIGQLVDSMDDAVLKMENAIKKNDINEANRLKVFVFDLHCQITRTMEGKNV